MTVINIKIGNDEFSNEEKFETLREPSKKIFKVRNSVLTDAMQNKHISGFYNLCLASTIVLVLANVLYEWRDNRIISFGVVELVQTLDKIEIGILTWLSISILTFLNFPMFEFWASIHRQTKYRKLFGTIFIMLHAAYQIGIQILSVYACLVYNLSPITTFAILLETLRNGMKCYAYVRSNAERVISLNEPSSPRWQHFMYFMFCPTMLYRDSYPRSGSRDWTNVFKSLLECVVAVYAVSLIYTIFLRRKFVDYGKSDVNVLALLIMWMEIAPTVTILFYFYAFYGLHHAWMNMFAEVLQFADRGFYLDWWNSTSFKEHYRRWGVLIHDWLYEYLYMELYRATKSIIASSLITIMVSAIVHEYVMIVTFRFFAPAVLFVYGVVGILYIYVPFKKRRGNIFFWFNLIIGLSLIVLVYILEYYARINCPAARNSNTTLAYYYTPMILKCKNIIW